MVVLRGKIHCSQMVPLWSITWCWAGPRLGKTARGTNSHVQHKASWASFVVSVCKPHISWEIYLADLVRAGTLEAAKRRVCKQPGGELRRCFRGEAVAGLLFAFVTCVRRAESCNVWPLVLQAFHGTTETVKMCVCADSSFVLQY